MNRRDYQAYAALRDTARMDRNRAYAVAVPIHKPLKSNRELIAMVALILCGIVAPIAAVFGA